MMSWLRHLIQVAKRSLRDVRGVTAVEFAIAVPFILLLILGTMEIGVDLMVDASVENAAQRASRLGLTTTVPTGETRDQAVQALVQNILSLWTRNAALTVVTKSYKSYNNVGQPEPYTDLTGVGHYVAGDPYTDVNGNGQWDADQGATGEGGYGDIVQYTITLTRPSFTGLTQLFGVANLVFTRTFIVQNETVQ